MVLGKVQEILAASDRLDLSASQLGGGLEARLSVVWSDTYQSDRFEEMLGAFEQRFPDLEFECLIAEHGDLVEVRTGEIGLKFQKNSTYWSTSIYDTKIDDLIAWMPTYGPGPFDSTWAPDNINNAKIQGLDITAGTAIDEWRFATHASLLNPVDEETGKRLLRRSKRFMGVDVDRDIGESVSVGASWNVQGGRTDAGDEYDGGYNTFDLRSSYAPMKDLKLSFSINNVFDTDYTVAYGYETPGVNAMLTAAYTF